MSDYAVKRAPTKLVSTESKNEKNGELKTNMQAWQMMAVSPVTPHYILTSLLQKQKIKWIPPVRGVTPTLVYTLPSRRQGCCRHDRLWCMLRCGRSAISIDTATAFFCVAMYLLYGLTRFSDLGSSGLVLQRAPVCDGRRCCACHAQCCA